MVNTRIPFSRVAGSSARTSASRSLFASEFWPSVRSITALMRRASATRESARTASSVVVYSAVPPLTERPARRVRSSSFCGPSGPIGTSSWCPEEKIHTPTSSSSAKRSSASIDARFISSSFAPLIEPETSRTMRTRARLRTSFQEACTAASASDEGGRITFPAGPCGRKLGSEASIAPARPS